MRHFFSAGYLIGIRNDVDNPTPQRFGTLQDCSVDISSSIKTLHGENDFAVDAAPGEKKVSGKAKTGNIDGKIFNELFFGMTSVATRRIPIIDESGTVPTTPFTITVANGATFAEDLGVLRVSDQKILTRVASGPATGQYSVNTTTGVYTFASADTGMAVKISYIYTGPSGGFTFTLSSQLMGSGPTFMLHLINQRGGNGMDLTLKQCRSNKLSLPFKQGDFSVAELDFEAYANASGDVLTWSQND